MFKINENYLKLPGSYLFSNIAKKVKHFLRQIRIRKLSGLGLAM